MGGRKSPISLEGRKTKGGPTEVDGLVGQRLRQRRTLLGVSQERLAESVGLTFQQIQKYEKGTNRISASRLYQLCNVLEVPVSYFFEGLKAFEQSGDSVALSGLAESDQDPFLAEDLMNRKETLDLVKTYYSIPDARVRKYVLRLIRSMSEKSETDSQD